jgi:hypothetical protein
LKQNPFQTGKLYKFTKKPPVAPIYRKFKTKWMGTTEGIDLAADSNYQNKILLCVDSSNNWQLYNWSAYFGLFLFDDQIIGLSEEWISAL